MPAIQPPAAGLKFLVSTDIEKPNPEVRKLIRSHTMLGKNRGKTLPPRKKKPKLQPASASASGVVSTNVLPATVPRKFGSDLSTIRLADAVEPAIVDVVLQFSSIGKRVLFPLSSCIFFEGRGEAWIAPLAIDPAYLHAMIFNSQFYFDAIVPRDYSRTQRSLPHFLQAVKLLRERFARGDAGDMASLTTTAAVMGLAGYSFLTGHLDAARNHMAGLRDIVKLRGGVSSFGANAKLLLEILRIDIGIALFDDSPTLFYNNSSLQESSYPPLPDVNKLLKLREQSETSYVYRKPEALRDTADELADIWKVMSEFCSIINYAASSQRIIPLETVAETTISVLYRLHGMNFNPSSSDEALRLGLLAFSSSIFLQWQSLGMSYHHLTSTFRVSLTHFDSRKVPQDLVLWLLMVGAAFVFDASDDGWLQPALLRQIGLCGITSWVEMRDLLSSFMWIGLIHDKPGKRVFESTVASPSSVAMGSLAHRTLPT